MNNDYIVYVEKCCLEKHNNYSKVYYHLDETNNCTKFNNCSNNLISINICDLANQNPGKQLEMCKYCSDVKCTNIKKYMTIQTEDLRIKNRVSNKNNLVISSTDSEIIDNFLQQKRIDLIRKLTTQKRKKRNSSYDNLPSLHAFLNSLIQ